MILGSGQSIESVLDTLPALFVWKLGALCMGFH